MRSEMAGMRAEMAAKADLAEFRSEMGFLRADVASDLVEVRWEIAGVCKELGE